MGRGCGDAKSPGVGVVVGKWANREVVGLGWK